MQTSNGEHMVAKFGKVYACLLFLSLAATGVTVDAKSVLIADKTEAATSTQKPAESGKSNAKESASKKSNDQKTSNAKPAGRKLAGAITEARALAIVSARPEVKKFLLALKNTKIKGSSAHVEFDRKEGTDLVVHVYEYVPDDAESGHTATFNWYHVNAKTGKVSAEF
jgi:hypothetical protein